MRGRGVGALAAVVGLVLSAGCGTQSKLVARADRAMDQGRFAHAYVDYRAALFHEVEPASQTAHRAFERAQQAIDGWLEAELVAAERELTSGRAGAAFDRLMAVAHPDLGATPWEARERQFRPLRPAPAPELAQRRDRLLAKAGEALWPEVEAEAAAGRWPRAVARARALVSRLPEKNPLGYRVSQLEGRAEAHFRALEAAAGTGGGIYRILAAWLGQTRGATPPEPRHRLRLVNATALPPGCETLARRLLHTFSHGDTATRADFAGLSCHLTSSRSRREREYDQPYTEHQSRQKCVPVLEKRCTGTDVHGKCILTTNVDTGRQDCRTIQVPITRYRKATRVEEVVTWTAEVRGAVQLSVAGAAVSHDLSTSLTLTDVGWSAPEPRPLSIDEGDVQAELAKRQAASLTTGLTRLRAAAGRLALDAAAAAVREGRADDVDRAMGEAVAWGQAPSAELVAFVAERHALDADELTTLLAGRWPEPRLGGPAPLPEADLAGLAPCPRCLVNRDPPGPGRRPDGLGVVERERGLSIGDGTLAVGWVDSQRPEGLGGFDRAIALSFDMRALRSTSGLTARVAADLGVGLDGGFAYRLEPMALGYAARLGPLRLGAEATLGLDGVLWGRVSSGLTAPVTAFLAFRPAGFVGLELEARAIWLLTTDSRQDGSRTLDFADEASASARLCFGDPDATSSYVLGAQAREWRQSTTWTFSLGFGACASALR